MRTKLGILFIFLLPVFGCSYFLVSWTASYLMISEDWKERLVFTPKTASKPDQIYEIDKLLYAFKIEPILFFICLVSLVLLIGIAVFWMKDFITKF
ncbi:DUF4306 domain-containing protein [Metabacillus idriensis]|uniref:DUF4306 domain-containing protein n=1 Tax=Metabacillus idriensis TaxID=324768 RepID=UPI00174DA176|nr:DUF4306 domain-containing protein [Metabacillus idriensis]